MELTPEQKQTVASWVAAGDNLSAVQKKLAEHFKVSMTYRDVRFLVDDLDLQLKDAPPKADSDFGRPAAGAPQPGPGEKKGFFDKAKEKLGLAKDPAAEAELDEDFEDALPAGGGRVSVSVDKVTLIPGAMASGTVTFSDGVSGKWIVDNYGRPGFTEIGRPDYRPSPADAQAFIQELNLAMQKRGL